MNEGCSWNHSLSHLGLGIWNDAEFQISPSSKHSSLLLRIKLMFWKLDWKTETDWAKEEEMTASRIKQKKERKRKLGGNSIFGIKLSWMKKSWMNEFPRQLQCGINLNLFGKKKCRMKQIVKLINLFMNSSGQLQIWSFNLLAGVNSARH